MGYVAINKLSLLDYPGKISCILFTNKCNFYCPFCHNGFTLLPSEDALDFEKDVLLFLKKRVDLLDAVVITGGEPTLLPDLKSNIQEIKKLGFLVKIDTNGTNPELIKELLDEKLIDYIAMDVKNSPHMYPATCGNNHVVVSNIIKSIELIKNCHIPYEFRTTLVHEFHTTTSIREMGEILKGARKLYLQRYRLSKGVINKSLRPVDEDTAFQFVDILKDYVSEVSIRGY